MSSSTTNSKVVPSAKDALQGVNLKGITVCVGGFGLGGIPETLLNELSQTKDAEELVVASLTGGVDGFGLGKLLEAGKVRRLISSYVGENKYLEESFFNGTLEVELTPQGTLAARMKVRMVTHSKRIVQKELMQINRKSQWHLRILSLLILI